MHPWKCDFSHIVLSLFSPTKSPIWLVQLLTGRILEGKNKQWHLHKSLTFLKSFPPNRLPGKPVEHSEFAASFFNHGGISWSAYNKGYNIEILCSWSTIISLACIMLGTINMFTSLNLNMSSLMNMVNRKETRTWWR